MSDVADFRVRDNRAPALIVAVLLHLGLFAFILLRPPGPPLLPIGSSVPINIVSSDPYTDTRPAVAAPETETATTPVPVPKAPPQPPAPVVAPPAFSAAPPKAKPQPVKPVPQQPSVHPTKPSDASPDFLNHLDTIIHNAQKTGDARAAAAPKGPARPATAPQARPDAGQGNFQSDMLGLTQLLERLWNPNCDVPGGSSVRLTARFTIGADGMLQGNPNVGGLEHSGDGVISAAARRAIDTVRQAEPYAQPFRGQTIVVNFDAKEACSKR